MLPHLAQLPKPANLKDEPDAALFMRWTSQAAVPHERKYELLFYNQELQAEIIKVTRKSNGERYYIFKFPDNSKLEFGVYPMSYSKSFTYGYKVL